MEKLYIINDEHLNKMKTSIHENMVAYKTGTYTLDNVDKAELKNLYIAEGLNEEMTGAIKRVNQRLDLFDSARMLHEGLRISPLLASNEGIWAYLTHGPLQGFSHTVWDFSQLSEKQSEEDYVMKHWFLDKHSDLMRNALASLWWSIEISKINDDGEPDPYRLSRVLFSNYTLRVVSLAQVLRMRNVLRGILEWLYRNNNGDNASLENRGKFIAKYLNQLAGIKQLSILGHDEIYALIDEVRDVILSISGRKDISDLTVAEIIYNKRNGK